LEALHPFGVAGAYVNIMMDEGYDRIRASYGRLTSVQPKYDPEKFFRINQNFLPGNAVGES
jgi:hypothetical protein